MTASTPLLVTFAAYLLVMIGIGFMAWRRTRTFDDYILGGRSLGSYVTALAAGASDMSGWLMMGLPGALYLGGASEAWIAIGLVIGAWQVPLLRNGFRLVVFSIIIMLVVLFYRQGMFGMRELPDILRGKRGRRTGKGAVK